MPDSIQTEEMTEVLGGRAHKVKEPASFLPRLDGGKRRRRRRRRGLSPSGLVGTATRFELVLLMINQKGFTI